jgi:hypothetical protein
MMKTQVRPILITIFSLAVLLGGIVAVSSAKIIPLRSGSMSEKKDAGIYSYIKAIDQADKEFWIVTTTCIIGKGGKVEVLVGEHHDKIKSEVLGEVFQDVYVAQLLRINNLEVEGLSAHGVPEGCISLP